MMLLRNSITGVLTADSAEGSAPQTLFVVEAIYDYEATAEDELTFHAGDRINVIQKACVLDFWGLFSQIAYSVVYTGSEVG